MSTLIKFHWMPLERLQLCPVLAVIEPQILVANLHASHNQKQTTECSVDHIEKEVAMIGVANTVIKPG